MSKSQYRFTVLKSWKPQNIKWPQMSTCSFRSWETAQATDNSEWKNSELTLNFCQMEHSTEQTLEKQGMLAMRTKKGILQ